MEGLCLHNDRPPTGPKKTVQWKFIARRLARSLHTPANQILNIKSTIRAAQGRGRQGEANEFGSAWSSFELGEQLPLGSLQRSILGIRRQNGIGSGQPVPARGVQAPEFKVTVKTPEVDGKKKAFRLGEKVEVNVQADYYFGGPSTALQSRLSLSKPFPSLLVSLPRIHYPVLR